MKPSVRVGLEFQAIRSIWLHPERGSSRGNLTYGAWGTHGGHGQQDDGGKGRIGEMGWGPRSAMAAAAADGIAGQPTLIGNANRKKSSIHSGNWNFFCAANQKKRPMMCTRKLNSLTKNCFQKKDSMKLTDVVSGTNEDDLW